MMTTRVRTCHIGFQKNKRRQRGSALAFLLILLLGIALLAMYANRSAILENRLSRGARDYQIAKDAAEAALGDVVNAIGASQGQVFRGEAYKAAAATQVGSCTTAGTTDGTGTQTAGGTATPGLVRFDGCGYAGAPWQTLTLSQMESISVPIGSITGKSTNSFSASGVVKSYKSPRAMIELITDQAGGKSAEAGAGTAQSYVFRITVLGYGPTSDTVVVLQETWRPPD